MKTIVIVINAKCSIFFQVRWDETSSIPRPERVSPWKIEPALAPPALSPVPMTRPKRPRSNMALSSPDSSMHIKEGKVFIADNISM